MFYVTRKIKTPMDVTVIMEESPATLLALAREWGFEVMLETADFQKAQAAKAILKTNPGLTELAGQPHG